MLLLAAAVVAATTCQADPSRREGPAFGRDAAAFVPKGWSQESLSEVDLNGDGKLDRVLVVRDADNANRRAIAALATPKGFRNVGEAALPGYPLGGGADVVLSDKRVLTITDLTGGTTANQVVMRYRYEGPDAMTGAMRYIGVDIHHYSRTNQHDWLKLSYNWLTGGYSQQVGKLTATRYAPQKPKTGKADARCWFMEDTADPDDFISAEVDHGDQR